MPSIDSDATRRYGELRGRGLADPSVPQHLFGDVLERVHSVLDQGGAYVVSEALFGGLSLPPRTFDCSHPFRMLVLRRGASTPFLAVWVESAALPRKR